jgi:ribosome-interacting GTPase 1
MTEKKYETIEFAKNDITRMLRGVTTTILAAANVTIQIPVTVEDLKTAVKQEYKQKPQVLTVSARNFSNLRGIQSKMTSSPS